MIRYLRPFLLIGLVFILLGLLYWGWSYIRRPSSFPFHHLHVSNSAQYVDAKRIEQLAWQHLEGGFFSLQVDQLKNALLKQPWIKSIAFQRKWPDTLDIIVETKHPEARWGADGVMSSEGDIFYPPANSIPNGLAQIDGPDAERLEIFDKFQKLSDDVQLLGLKISRMQVSPLMVYQVTLSNGIVVMIGRRDVLFRFARFVDMYPKTIGNKSSKVENVDLRYSNGFAIKWKK